MPLYWCEWSDPGRIVAMNVEAEDATVAALRFEDFHGFLPHEIDDRKVRCYCEFCKAPIFEGEFGRYGPDELETPEGITFGAWECLGCLTGHENGGAG